MKNIIYLDIGNQLSYRPRFKRGTGLILGGSMLAGVLGSVGSAAISSAGQNSVNKKQMNFAESENQKNRDWQSEEAQIARDWNRQEWDRQFQLENQQWFTQLAAQNGIWKQQQDYLNAYNSPESQVKRLQAAGLNPALALGDSGNASGMAPATTTNVNAPANVASPVASPIGNSTVPLGNPSQYFAQSFMQSFQSFANGFKQLVTAGPEGQKLGSEAQKAASDMLVNQRNAEQLELKNYILSQSKDARIKQVFADLDETTTGIWLKKLSGELTQSQIDKAIQDTLTSAAEEMLKCAQTDQIRQAMSVYIDNVHAQWDYWKKSASAALTSASAQMVNASAMSQWLEKRGITEDAIRPLLVDNQALQNDLLGWQSRGAKVETFFKEKTVQAKISQEIEKAKQMRLITADDAARLKSDLVDGKYAEIQKFVNLISGIGSTYRDFGIGNNSNMSAATSIMQLGF